MTVDPSARPPLDVDALRGLGRDVPGLRAEVLEQTSSTNAVAAERARAGEPEGLVVVAEHQTAGRGRLDRRWEAPPRSSVILSLLLRPTVATRAWPWLPLLTGLGVGRALRELGVDAGVKWPNDVMVGDRKVAGILVERIETPQGPAAVVGVGLNVSLAAEELPVPTATSLALELGAPPDRSRVLVGVLGALKEGYDAWQTGGAAGAARLAEAYAADCVTLGREVRVELPGGGALRGRAVAVDPGGRLVVEGPEGRTAVGAGDVVHVRPADQ